MFGFRHPAQRADDGRSSAPPSPAFKPLRYDPELVADLLKRQLALEANVAALAPQFHNAPASATQAAQQCTEQLNELRRWEAIRLYPVVSRGLSGDTVAQRQWVVLRFVVNGLAHRLLRSMEELCLVGAKEAPAALAATLENLRAYRERNEAEIYPLYALMDPCRARRA